MRNKNNLNFNVPKNSDAKITREHTLRNTIFTRTRIAVLALVLIVALSITGTLAYITWSSNQTANRQDIGSVQVEIIEDNIKNATTTTVKTASPDNQNTGTAEAGTNTKSVKLTSNNNINDEVRADEVVRVQFVPEIESKQLSGANVAINEYWGEGIKTDTATNKKYVETSVLKLWLADDVETNWIYSNGAFIYKKVLQRGAEETPVLLTGATLQDSANKSDYSSIKVRVVADAIQASPSGALDDWGLQVTGTGSSRVVSLKS